MGRVVSVLMLLLILLPACSSGELGREEPTPKLSNSLDGLNSYRARILMRWQSKDGLSTSTETETEATRQPLAQRIIMVTEEGAFEWVRVGGTEWTCTDGACLPRPEALLRFGEEVILWDDQMVEIFEGLNYRYLGEETISEVHSLHYAISSPPPGVFGPLREDATDVQAEIWVADEEALPAFVVRVVTSWQVVVEGEDGEGEYSLDIYDVNVPFTIETPAGAPAAVPEEIPLYGVGTQPLLGGSVSFSSQASPATVADFYRSDLATLGWTLESEETGESLSQLWSKAGWYLTLVISPKEGGCSVAIEMAPR
jgi:hypothetical protein